MSKNSKSVTPTVKMKALVVLNFVVDYIEVLEVPNEFNRAMVGDIFYTTQAKADSFIEKGWAEITE